MAGLERYPALSAAQIERTEADAIVVLGASRYLQAPEYGEDSVSRDALYVCDTLNRRAVRAVFTHAARAVCEVK